MARKKINHALHIKSHTQGSSNEISFSVLDAAREAREAADRDRRPGVEAGRVPLFTLGKGKKPRATPEKGQHIVLPEGASANLPRSSAPSRPLAPAPLKDRTPLRFVPFVVGICVVVALVLTVGQTLFQVRTYQDGLRGALAAQIEIINEADTVVIPLDTLVMAQYAADYLSKTAAQDGSLHENLAANYRGLVGDIAPVRSQLEAAIDEIERVQPSLTDNNDKEASYQALAAARARLNMLDTGIAVIDQALAATEAFEEAGRGWKDLIDADAAAREATELLREMSEENVRASMEKTNTALTLLNSAASRFAAAQGAYPGLDLQRFSDYAARRAEAQQAALAADQAYLDRNKELLAQENERYNALEEEAAALAQELGDDPDVVVASFYRAAIDKDAQLYESERLKAGNADAFLRDYLGSGAQ